jgi:hypothetical protein
MDPALPRASHPLKGASGVRRRHNRRHRPASLSKSCTASQRGPARQPQPSADRSRLDPALPRFSNRTNPAPPLWAHPVNFCTFALGYLKQTDSNQTSTFPKASSSHERPWSRRTLAMTVSAPPPRAWNSRTPNSLPFFPVSAWLGPVVAVLARETPLWRARLPAGFHVTNAHLSRRR